jgi:F0F1-type ATP synthase assembly protein I
MAKCWTRKTENLARKTALQAKGYAWMYERMAYLAQSIERVLNIISGILGGLVGTTGLIDVFNTTAPIWPKIIEIIVGFFIGILAIFNSTWDLNTIQRNSILSQAGYDLLSRDIACLLSHSRRDRPDAIDYLRAKNRELCQLKLSAPIIGKHVKKSYLQHFKDDAIFGPDITQDEKSDENTKSSSEN